MPRAGRVAIVAFAGVALACQPQPTPSSQASVAPIPASTNLVSAAPEPPTTPLPSGVAAAFPIALTDPEGKYPLDVTLLDRTGLVTAVDTFIREDKREGLAAAEGGPGLEYVWETGACALRTTLTLERSDVFDDSSKDTFRLTNVLDEESEACFLLGVLRPIVIRLREPISADRVSVIEGAETSYRLMFDHVLSGRATEFELLDGTGLVAGLSNTTKLGIGNGLSDATPDVGLIYSARPSLCTYRIVLSVDGTGTSRYRMQVWFDTRWRSGCAMNDAGRWFLVELRQPVPVNDIEVVEQPDPEPLRVPSQVRW